MRGCAIWGLPVTFYVPAPLQKAAPLHVFALPKRIQGGSMSEELSGMDSFWEGENVANIFRGLFALPWIPLGFHQAAPLHALRANRAQAVP